MRVERVTVAGDRVQALLGQLDRQYTGHIFSVIYNPGERLYFVPSDEPYNLFHDCNRQTADWLEELGVRVDGLVILSRFQVAR
jgi:hypothetical protein